MENRKNSLIKAVLLTGASFTGYNIGSGFATGMEALQFFGSWGVPNCFISLLTAFLFALAVFVAVYVTGFEQKFDDSKKVYRYFCGERFGVIFDYYIYISMIIITLTLVSGAGATINQYSGIPTYIGAAVMGVVCVVTSLLGLERLRRVLSYLCVLIVLFIFGCAAYVGITSDISVSEGAANTEAYAASGEIIRSGLFGFSNPVLSGFTSAGLLIISGFAWSSATGALCRSKKEALCSGVLSSVLFYGASAVVLYLVLVSMDNIAGKEVPMLAVTQRFAPVLSPVYSLIIVLAIFSTISGRLFLIGERYGRGSKKRSFIIVTAITVFACVGASFIPFSKLSGFMFSFCGAAGIVFGIVVLIRFITRSKKMTDSV